MKGIVSIVAVLSALGLASAAFAEPYVDYTAKKGVWEVQTIAVDPNHLDDYLVGLKANLVPGFEVAKQHGVIDQYGFLVKLNPNGADANVMVIQHYPSLAMLDPDKARDKAIEAESYAKVSKADGEKRVKVFETYRKFVSDEYWVDIQMAK